MQLGPDVDPLAAVLAVAAHHRVAQRLGQDHPQPEPRLCAGLMPRQAVARDELDGLLDAPDIARHPQGDERDGTPGVLGRRAADAEAKRRRHGGG